MDTYSPTSMSHVDYTAGLGTMPPPPPLSPTHDMFESGGGMRDDLLPYDAELDAATTTGDCNTATRDGSTEEQLRAAKRQRLNAKDGVMGVGGPRRVGTILGVSKVKLFKSRWLSHFTYSIK